MSQNRTVSWRRSAAEAAVVVTVGVGAWVRLLPQSEQNLAEGGFATPQVAQRIANGAPHSLQKRALSGTLALQTRPLHQPPLLWMV